MMRAVLQLCRIEAFFVAVLALSLGMMSSSALSRVQDEGESGGEVAPQDTTQVKGEAALAEGRGHLAAGRWQSAINAFMTALGYLPSNDEARQGLSQAQTMLDEEDTIVREAEDAQRLLEQAKVEFEASMQRAEELLVQMDFTAARRSAVTGQVKLQERRRSNVFTPAEFRTRNSRAEAMLAKIEQARDAHALELEIDNRNNAVTEKMRREQEAAQQRQHQINENLRRATQLAMDMRYREALQVVDQILFMDEHNPSAMGLHQAYSEILLYQEMTQIEKQREESYAQVTRDAVAATIAPHRNISGPGKRSISGLMEYPSDWPQLSQRRIGDLGGETPEDRAVFRQLESTPLPVNFSGNTFAQVVSYVRDVTDMDVYVDWRALNAIGINPGDELDLQLNQLTAKNALNRIMEQLGDGDYERPDWTVQDGTLTISSSHALRKHTMTRLYDIRDLLFEVPVFDNAPDLDLNTALNQGKSHLASGGSGGGGGGDGLFNDPEDDPERSSRENLVHKIIGIMQQTIDPDGWRGLGGDTGSLLELNGNLIITQTARNHRSIEGLLAQLREIRALQINVESRFLSVITDWFEKIGIDLDLYFNTNNTQFQQAQAIDPNFHLSNFFDSQGNLLDPIVFGSFSQVQGFDPSNPAGPPFNNTPTGGLIGVPDATGTNIVYLIPPVGAPLSATSGFAPIGVTQNNNSLLNSLAGFSLGEFAGIASANPALVTGIRFLDDIQIDLLIEATQADKRNVTLTAPRLTFFNGQRAWIAVTTQTFFVSGLTPIVAGGAVAFQPQVTAALDGFVLDVEAVISADRRYVTMTVIFGFAELLGFKQASPIEAASSGGAQGGSAGAAIATSFELPQVRGSFVRTTVSVPDKGTILLGGQRNVKEIEVETGVPVLSKIPFINRFFTNRATSQSENTLLILIRPEIIIQQENEDILFPGLSDQLGSASSYLR